MSKLVRYRFCTRAVDDFRPLVDMRPIGMPWWCTGVSHRYVTIVCYLPEGEPLEKYWDDAFDIYEEHVDEIVYTGRFPKPEWLEEESEDEKVTRCRDCKHWTPYIATGKNGMGDERCPMKFSRADDYCSRAERKEVEDGR